MICMQRSAHSCEICVELLAGISVLEYAFCTRHNSPLSIMKYGNSQKCLNSCIDNALSSSIGRVFLARQAK